MYVMPVDQKCRKGNENRTGQVAVLCRRNGKAWLLPASHQFLLIPCAFTQTFSQLVEFTTLLSAPGPLHTPFVETLVPPYVALLTPSF